MSKVFTRIFIGSIFAGLTGLLMVSCDQPAPIGDDERYLAYPGLPYTLMVTLVVNRDGRHSEPCLLRHVCISPRM